MAAELKRSRIAVLYYSRNGEDKRFLEDLTKDMCVVVSAGRARSVRGER
jgi:hypothetical protein